MSWKGTEKYTFIPRKGIGRDEKSGTGQITGQGLEGRERQAWGRYAEMGGWD